MPFVLIIAFILRTGPDAVTTQVSFLPARYYVTYDACMNDSKARVDQALQVHPTDFNTVLRYNCVPVVDNSK